MFVCFGPYTYNHIELASKLNAGCDYSLFKVRKIICLFCLFMDWLWDRICFNFLHKVDKEVFFWIHNSNYVANDNSTKNDLVRCYTELEVPIFSSRKQELIKYFSMFFFFFFFQLWSNIADISYIQGQPLGIDTK